ncbi:hypothetical protein [Candidatus Thiosymbion oneisti]|uniref:hypothetical protein n=1 Tax=Candidatus Thiosymbion oneisti TaxID=589554 RepID=UPI0010619061|nr:hypothetical protein [Candidatus Thiosymbion oneisti]
MSVDSFVDTNVLVYAATCDEVNKAKRDRALELIDTENFALSAQVLQEFYVTEQRKGHPFFNLILTPVPLS